MLDIKEKYCPAPWTGMFHQLNYNSPCHTNRNNNEYTPMQYMKSEFLRDMKKDFLNDKFPDSCYMCKSREEMNLKSTRGEILRRFNEKNMNGRYTLDDNQEIMRLELRFSNLCNFKCRMCEPYSSSEIARELIKHDMLSFGFADNEDAVLYSDDKQIDELKPLVSTLRTLCLTGGEPFLIKQYYSFLDYIIESGYSSNIEIEIFTNCSVYNEKFIDKLLKFKKVSFVISIDGAGKTAEYIRHGTKWDVVSENMLKFAKLPFDLSFNTAISQYTLLDASNLAKFLVKLYEVNPSIKTKCYAVIVPDALHFLNMPLHHRERAAREVKEACEILTQSNFDILKKEICGIIENIQNSDPVNPNAYIEFTETLDKRRNENFEDVFGISLR